MPLKRVDSGSHGSFEENLSVSRQSVHHPASSFGACKSEHAACNLLVRCGAKAAERQATKRRHNDWPDDL
ncbi:hypothetical protein EP837_00696 [Sphingobium sp. EP60837]|nr:hypothetical protein EP837_00696 [Sphingobium sp. EP60837]